MCVRRASVDQYKDVVGGVNGRGGERVCGRSWDGMKRCTGVKRVRRNTRFRRPVDPVNGVYII